LCDETQLNIELVPGIRCPRLPCLHDGGRVFGCPPQAERGGGRGSPDGLEDEGGNDTELAAAGTSKRPEQVGLAGLVAPDHLPVGEDDLGGDEVITGQSVGSAQEAEAAPEDVTGDPHRPPSTRGQDATAGFQRVVDVT
jgi:hypothetical protein